MSRERAAVAISTDYKTPVYVNGFACKNCTDVDNAKKHIDPQHPKSGPYGINAETDPSAQRQSSVIFSGALSGNWPQLKQPSPK